MPKTIMPTNEVISAEAREWAGVWMNKIAGVPEKRQLDAVENMLGELFRRHTVVFGVWQDGDNICVAVIKGRELVDNVRGVDNTGGAFTWTAILCPDAEEARHVADDFGDFRPDQSLRMLN